MERRQKNDLFEIGSVWEIAETNWRDGSWVFIILLHPLLCMFEIFHCNTFKNSLFSVRTESSPATQFESISSSGLSLLYGPILTPIRDYWKNHSFDYMDLCQQSFEYMVCHIWFEYMVCRQSDVSTFQYAVYVCHSFPRSKQFLISWLQSPSAVIFEPKETKPVTASTIRRRHSKIFKAKQKLTLNWLSLVINSIPISTASEQQLWK